MNRALPSHMPTFAPRRCQLQTSSFGPQFVWFQGQPGGPPTGASLPLIGLMRLPGVLFGWPEMPPELAGSAQRFITRRPLAGAPSPGARPPDVIPREAHHWAYVTWVLPFQTSAPPPLNT